MKTIEVTRPEAIVEVGEDIQTIVDSGITVEAEVLRLKRLLAPQEKKLKELKGALSSIADELVGPRPTSLAGTKGAVEIGKPATVTTFDKEAIFDVLGNDDFFTLADFKIGELRKHCSATELEQILTEEDKGTRRFKFIEDVEDD